MSVFLKNDSAATQVSKTTPKVVIFCWKGIFWQLNTTTSGKCLYVEREAITVLVQSALTCAIFKNTSDAKDIIKNCGATRYFKMDRCGKLINCP